MIDAVPLPPNVADPIVVVPSLNVTVPVGVPVAGATGLTVAVRVTACPVVEGLGADVRVVVVDAAGALTTWVTTGEVLARKFPAPA